MRTNFWKIYTKSGEKILLDRSRSTPAAQRISKHTYIDSVCAGCPVISWYSLPLSWNTLMYIYEWGSLLIKIHSYFGEGMLRSQKRKNCFFLNQSRENPKLHNISKNQPSRSITEVEIRYVHSVRTLGVPFRGSDISASLNPSYA